MNLLDSLLAAILRVHGDALIMHVGEKPYIVTSDESTDQVEGSARGRIEVPSRVLTQQALIDTLERILSSDQRAALDARGAIQVEVTSPLHPADRFVVAASHGGGGVWLEVRRRPARDASPARTSAIETGGDVAVPAAVGPEGAVAVERQPAAPPTRLARQAPPFGGEAGATERPPARTVSGGEAAPADRELISKHVLPSDAHWIDEVMTEGDLCELLRDAATHIESSEPARLPKNAAGPSRRVRSSFPAWAEEDATDASGLSADDSAGPTGNAPSATPSPINPSAPRLDQPQDAARLRPAVIVPLSRPTRPEAPADIAVGIDTIERLLRISARRGASTVYVHTESAPMLRIGGEWSVLDGEPGYSASVVERLSAALAPYFRAEAASSTQEWTMEVADLGEVRCMAFRDQRGPGLVFHLIPRRALAADEIALPTEVQALSTEADGLILVAGSRGSGRSTLLAALVDLINATRSDHVITIESRIDVVHVNRRSFVSQRETPGDASAVESAVRAACREKPDVLVIEEIRTRALLMLALDAAQEGRLVLASLQAASALHAVERILGMFPPENRPDWQARLAAALRAIVSQVLLRKLKGGVAVAREVLINTTAVARLLTDGDVAGLPAAIDTGRSVGMMPLAESLAALIREGTVHAAHASRRAPDRERLLAILRRDGVDTSFAEHFA